MSFTSFPKPRGSSGGSSGSLRQVTLVGVVWSGIGQYGANVIHYLTFLILAGLLTPSDFGLLALAMIYVLVAQAIGELGLAAAMIQQKEVRETDLSTAFWSNFLVSLVLAGATFLLAEPITLFLGDTDAAPVLTVLALAFPLNAVSVVHRSMLQKRLDFRPLSFQQLAGEVGFALVSVTMAWQGWGVWSFAGGILAQRCICTVTLFCLFPWIPRLELQPQSFKRLLLFGGPFLLGAIVQRGLIRSDYFVVGHFVGTEALGYYSMAFQLAVVPIERLAGILGRVAFPALSLLQGDRVRLTKAFAEGLQHTLTIVVPVCLFVAVLGPRLMLGIYGEKWVQSIDPLRILALFSLGSIIVIMNSLFFALGRPGLRLWLSLARFLAFAGFVASIGLAGGINGVAVGMGISLLAVMLASLWMTCRLIGLSPSTLTSAVWPSFRAASLSLLPVIGLWLASSDEQLPWLGFAALGALMGLLYLCGIFPSYRHHLSEYLNPKGSKA